MIDLKLQMMNAVNNNVFPGATYALIYKGELIIDSVGNKSLYPNEEPNSIDTIYDLASLTKVISTNTIIFLLIKQDKIHLEDKVASYLPRFKYDDVTIKDLLTHSSGLPADVPFSSIKTKDELLDFIYNLDKTYETGSISLYSDIGFILLGFIIEKILEKSLDICAYELVFKPLGMNNTSYNPNTNKCAPTELQDNKYTKGIVHDEKAKLLNGIAGHAGVFSNINDLVKFARMIINNGCVNNDLFLDKKYIDMWFNKENIDGKNNRSLGWICGPSSNYCDKVSNNTIFHTGFTGTRFLLDRDNDLCFIILSNRVHPTRDNKRIIPFTKEILESIYNDILSKDNVYKMK